jgi:hypothetical protein
VGVGGGFPGGPQIGGDGRGDLQQAVAELLLGFGQSGERVDAQQQGAGFLVVDVEDLDVHLHVGVDVAAEVAVDQLESAVGELVGQQAAGEADLVVEGFQGGALQVGVQAESSARAGSDRRRGRGGGP